MESKGQIPIIRCGVCQQSPAVQLPLASVLVIAPDADDQLVAAASLVAAEVHHAQPHRALEALAAAQPALVLVAQDPPRAAIALVRDICRAYKSLPLAVVAAEPSLALAVQFVRAGALDYIPGPLTAEGAARLLDGLAGERMRPADEQQFFCDDCPPGVPFAGRSPATVRTLQAIRLVAQSRCNPILILGETGAGKEVAAQAAHFWRTGRAEGLVAVNCAALTANLLESELFGHVKGAFTGADRDKAGLFEVAAGGTIFLDEISEMPLDLQAKLLRVLQERSFRRVGATRDIRCDCTVIASSNRNLHQEVAAGRFRRDLYYRLAVFPVALSPLRSPDRRDDVELLAEFFLRQFSSAGATARQISPEAMRLLTAHAWPGNVRELRNVIERAMILEPSHSLTAASIVLDAEMSCPPALIPPTAAAGTTAHGIAGAPGGTGASGGPGGAGRETGYQRTRAAALLGITRATLHAKLKRYDIKVPAPGPQQ
jgi:DNA-binding NtrC family response regulator